MQILAGVFWLFGAGHQTILLIVIAAGIVVGIVLALGGLVLLLEFLFIILQIAWGLRDLARWLIKKIF